MCPAGRPERAGPTSSPDRTTLFVIQEDGLVLAIGGPFARQR